MDKQGGLVYNNQHSDIHRYPFMVQWIGDVGLLIFGYLSY
jgi:hypothetical protein